MELLWTIGIGIISIILCIFGIKLLKVCTVAVATLVGAAIAYGSTTYIMSVEGYLQWIVIAVAALAFAVLAIFFKRFGIFVFCLVGVTGMLFVVAKPANMFFYAIYGGIGMLLAIAAMSWLDPVFIFATAFVGGIGIGNVVLTFLPVANIFVRLAVYAVPVLIGCFVQFVLRSREIGRKEAVHAKEVKKESSMEEEVEQARTLFDDALTVDNLGESEDAK